MDQRPITENTLFYGDNLKILREYITSECIDLIYLDPPFNSNRNYNVLFKDESGTDSEAQIVAFEDTWHWNQTAEETYRDLQTQAPDNVSQMITTLRGFVGTNQMLAYLVMMAARLIELHRVLKPTGSLYLHCDPTASHYLKIILDAIFGAKNFRNEIIWKRKTGRGDTGGTSKKFGTSTDVLLFYGKTDTTTFNQLYRPNNPDYIEKFFKYVDEKGRRYRSADLSSPSPRPNLTYEYKGYKPPHNGWAISKRVFGSGRHAVLLQEGHGHGTLKTFHVAKSLNARQCELRECLVPMKSALSKEKMEEWDAEGRLIFPKSKDGRIQRKRYLDVHPGESIQRSYIGVE